MNSGGYPFPQENQPQGKNYWVPALSNNAILSRANPVAIQLQGTNFESSNWQQLLNDQALGSVSSYQSVQDLDAYQQVGRNGVQNFNPNSFMALLGVDGSYGLEGTLVDHNQGFNRAPDPSMHGNLTNGIDTLGSNSAVKNPPWMLYSTE